MAIPKLKKDGFDNLSATLIDAELDEFECYFNGDMCINIDTKDLEYLTLTKENLDEMKKLIDKAEKKIYG